MLPLLDRSLHFCLEAGPPHVFEEDKFLVYPGQVGRTPRGDALGWVSARGAPGLTPLPTRGETAKLWVLTLLRCQLRQGMTNVLAGL